MKKALSWILSVVLVLSIAVPMVSAEASTCSCGKSPIVYVSDMFAEENTVLVDKDAASPVPAINIDRDKLKDDLLNCWRSGLSGMLFGTWSIFDNQLYQAIIPYIKDYSLNSKGKLDEDNNSGIAWSWDANRLPDTHKLSGMSGAYYYYYDARLDPFTIAMDLNKFIDTVKEITGHNKVNLIAEGFGANIAFTYLQEYQKNMNFSGVESFVVYAGFMNGVAMYSDFFCGRINTDGSAISRYASNQTTGNETSELVKSTLNFLATSGLMNVATDLFSYVYTENYQILIPKILKESFAYDPGIWSMIDEESYDSAKDFIFGEYSNPNMLLNPYGTLLDTIDKYHYTIQLGNSDVNDPIKRTYKPILDKMKAAGVKVGIICKYGFQLPPIAQRNNLMSDETVDLTSQSFGATCADVNGTLSNEQKLIANTERAVPAEYISADNQINAYTCQLPENTWFIKNLAHEQTVDSVTELMLAICRSASDFTVKSDAKFPRFMVYNANKDTVNEMDENNSNTNNWMTNLWQSIRDFFSNIFKSLVKLLTGIVNPA